MNNQQNKIKMVLGRCASGKTEEMIQYIKKVKHHKQFIIALPTKAVISEVTKRLDTAGIQYSSINGDNHDAVISNLVESIISNQQIIVCTHKSLELVEVSARNYDLIIDEQPSVIELNQVQVGESHFNEVDSFAHEVNGVIKSKITQDELDVSIADKEADDVFATAFCEFVKSVKASSFDKTNNTVIIQEADGDTDRRYGIVKLSLLLGNMKNYKSVTVMTADNMKGLFGSLCRAGNIQRAEANFANNLPDTFENEVKIVPLLSTATRGNFNKVEDGVTNQERMIKLCLENGCRLFMTNSDNKHKQLIHKLANKHGVEVEVINPICHGRDDLKKYHKIGVIYTDKGQPAVRKALRYLDGSTTNSPLHEAYLISKYFDVIYQTVSRTCVRNINDKRVAEFYVPDVAAAEYLKERFVNAEIDLSLKLDITDKRTDPTRSAIGELFRGHSKTKYIQFNRWMKNNLEKVNLEDSSHFEYGQAYLGKHNKAKGLKGASACKVVKKLKEA